MRTVPTITCLPVLLVLVLAACAHPSAVQQTPIAPVTSTAATATTYALSGVVDTAPACPGPERMDTPCPPRPLTGATVTASISGTVLATTTTNASGMFTLQLPPGRYLVVARQLGGFRSQVSMLVQVPQSQRLKLTVDSGIR